MESTPDQSAASVQVRVLGPVEIATPGRSGIVLTGKPRKLLAILVVRAGESVSRDALIEDLWSGRPPRSAEHALDVHVSRLRASLGDTGARVLRTTSSGYQLAAEAIASDMERFERLVHDARAALADGRVGEAAADLDAALKLWRGRPFADVEDWPGLVGEVRRLEELRVEALEARADVDLASGRHAAAVAPLAQLLARYPLRDGLRGRLMLALHRSGRRAEALDVYAEGRRILAEELGLEPGQALQSLHESILRSDTTLAPPPGAQPATRPPPRVVDAPAPQRRLRSRLAPVAALGAIGLAAAAGATATLVRGGGDRSGHPESAVPAAGAAVPSVRTLLPFSVGPTAVVLRAVVSPGESSASYRFEYGRGRRLGQVTPSRTLPALEGATEVTSFVGKLRPATRYRFRVLAEHAGGRTAVGSALAVVTSDRVDRFPRSQVAVAAYDRCFAQREQHTACGHLRLRDGRDASAFRIGVRVATSLRFGSYAAAVFEVANHEHGAIAVGLVRSYGTGFAPCPGTHNESVAFVRWRAATSPWRCLTYSVRDPDRRTHLLQLYRTGSDSWCASLDRGTLGACHMLPGGGSMHAWHARAEGRGFGPSHYVQATWGGESRTYRFAVGDGRGGWEYTNPVFPPSWVTPYDPVISRNYSDRRAGSVTPLDAAGRRFETRVTG
jgi:DNA-binding SARP family transcriptional activator